MTVEFFVPFPGSALSPNARGHWSKKAKAAKAYRNECGWTAKCAGIGKIDAQTLDVSMTFFPPSKRRYDLDNLIARMKPGLDGIADVVGIDDSRWTLSASKASPVLKQGMVKIELSWSA